MKRMRQLVTKTQWFVLFNCSVVIVMYLTGNLRWNSKSVISNLIALLAVNGAAWISAGKYTDWKK